MVLVTFSGGQEVWTCTGVLNETGYSTIVGTLFVSELFREHVNSNRRERGVLVVLLFGHDRITSSSLCVSSRTTGVSGVVHRSTGCP